MRLIVLILLGMLLIGCAQIGSDQVEPPPINDAPQVPPSPPIQDNGVFKNQLPCVPSTTGTIEIVGKEMKTFRGSQYEFCHSKTRASSPPSGTSGTPEFVDSDTWSFVNQAAPYTIIDYTDNRYTLGYSDGGLSFQKADGTTCYTQGTPKGMDNYTDSELICG